MPSGKKARGRKKRAKKEATLMVAQRALWEPAILRNNGGASNDATTSSCEHMMAVLPRIPQEGPAVSLMNCLAGQGFFKKEPTCFISGSMTMIDFCLTSVTRFFPEVRGEESERSLAINLLLRFVRNVLLHGFAIEGERWFHGHAPNEVAICTMIDVLELLGTYSDRYVAICCALNTSYGISSDMNVVRRKAFKINNKLANGNHRDIANLWRNASLAPASRCCTALQGRSSRK